MKNEENIRNRNNAFLDNLGILGREKLIRKIVKKYESPEYRDQEYSKGYEPRCPLYDVLFDWAETRCQRCFLDVNDWFPETQYDIDGKFIITMIIGQGVIIQISEIKEGQIIPHFPKKTETITIYYPDGREIITTPLRGIINDVISQIKTPGFYYTTSDGTKHEITGEENF